ncbi:pentapeptide repeat-containing protein [Shewanella sp. A25]|nr:pentapeptide repeat-containing protein [Shewanella shenzhenensis]
MQQSSTMQPSIMQMAAKQGSHFYAQQFNQLNEADSQWHGLEFEECEFHDCNFSAAQWRKCKFSDCRFIGCNLSLLELSLSQFSGVEFDECKLVGIDWTRASWPPLTFASPLIFRASIVSDSSFMGLKLDEMVMQSCRAHDVDFRDGRFHRADFSGTDFGHSLFGRTELIDADFTDATDYDIDIFSNKIKGAKFSREEAIRLLNGLDIELV